MEQKHLLALGVATLGVLALYLLSRPVKPGAVGKDKLVDFLQALAKKWFVACRDTAELARSIRQKLQAQNVTLPEEEFKDQLLNHCGVLKNLEKLQEDSFKEFGESVEDIVEAQTIFADDPIVMEYSRGFTSMLEDSVNGIPPVMPNLEIPDALTEKHVLLMFAQMQEVEIKRVVEHFAESGGFLPSVEVLTQVLTLANKESESEVLEKNNTDLITFHSTVATYLRKSSSFVKKKAELDNNHKDRMVKMFKPAPKAGSGPSASSSAPSKRESVTPPSTKTSAPSASPEKGDSASAASKKSLQVAEGKKGPEPASSSTGPSEVLTNSKYGLGEAAQNPQEIPEKVLAVAEPPISNPAQNPQETPVEKISASETVEEERQIQETPVEKISASETVEEDIQIQETPMEKISAGETVKEDSLAAQSSSVQDNSTVDDVLVTRDARLFADVETSGAEADLDDTEEGSASGLPARASTSSKQVTDSEPEPVSAKSKGKGKGKRNAKWKKKQ